LEERQAALAPVDAAAVAADRDLQLSRAGSLFRREDRRTGTPIPPPIRPGGLARWRNGVRALAWRHRVGAFAGTCFGWRNGIGAFAGTCFGWRNGIGVSIGAFAGRGSGTGALA